MASEARLLRAILLGVVLPLAAAFPAVWLLESTPALAQPSAGDKETARDLMKEGDAKFAAKDYSGALKAYQSAHAIMQVPTTGLPLAKAQIEKGLLVEARDTLLQVTRHPKDASEPAAFAKSRDEAAALAAKIAPTIPSLAIAIEGAPSDAVVEVTVDGIAVPAGALSAPRKVNPGSHTITASAPGFSATSTVTVTQGETSNVKLKLKPGQSGPPTKVEPGGSGVLRVESPTEPGNVFLDGKAVGATPVNIPTSTGSHKVEIEYPGGTHEERTVTVPRGGKEVAVFQPSTMDAVARHRKGVHIGFAFGPTMAVHLEYGAPLYGGAASFLVNIGITPAFDFRTGVTASGLHRASEYGARATQVSAVVPATLRINWSPWFSSAAGLSAGFAVDFLEGPNNAGFSIGPEWSALSMCAGEKREYELTIAQGLRFGDIRPEYHQSIIFTYLLLN